MTETETETPTTPVITPTQTRFHRERGFHIKLPKGISEEDAFNLVAIPPGNMTYNGNIRQVAYFDGERFKTAYVNLTVWKGYLNGSLATEMHCAVGILYYPINPRILATDIYNAVTAGHDSKGWVFWHAHLEEHQERLFQAKALVYSLFQDGLDQRMLDIISVVKTGQEARAKSKRQTLVDFRDKVIKNIVETDKLNYLGKFRKYPTPMIYAIVSGAISQIKAMYIADEDPDKWLRVSQDVQPLLDKLQTLPTNPTRWEQVEALKDAENEVEEG